MKIVSKFKDYYDCMLKFGFSKEPLYIRDTKVVDIDMYHRLSIIPNTVTSAYTGAVLFCGTVYPFTYSYQSRGTHTVVCNCTYRGDTESNFFNMCGSGYNKTRTWSRDCSKLNDLYKSPVIVFRSSDFGTYGQVLEINANLSLYNFQSAKSPWEAFQEIERWLSNQAQPEKSIPTVSNNDMIEAKGFDLKTSFRKEKKVVK